MPSMRRGSAQIRRSSLAMPAAASTPQPFLGKRALIRSLEKHLTAEDTTRLLALALEDAGLDDVPSGREEFEAFVREAMLPSLLPLLRLDQVHDLVRRTLGGEDGLHPPPIGRLGGAGAVAPRTTERPRVVVVEARSTRRLDLARALVRDGFDVEVVATAPEVLQVEPYHALVMALDEAGERAAAQLAAAGTRAGLVTYDDPSAKGAIRRVIANWPSDRVSIVARTAHSSVLGARVRIVLG